MLPFRTGSLVVSDPSKEKLDRFYRRFISQSGNHLDAVNHIIYACHAAMPLLLSPELANLTWLNFNSYTIKGKIQKIDRVVVSDFLLSSLVRPVGGRQYELIPEIRTYLLYLLNDNKWFKFLGIESFGPERVTTLAQFLLQYLADKRSASENNAAGFREINDWAAKAYLYPNELAMEIAKAYESTFANPEKTNEKGQLRLNMLMERFAQQVNMNIHAGDPEKKSVFMNVYRYSKANKAYLFKEEMSSVSDKFYEVDDEFLELPKSTETVIQLPLRKAIGQRLGRKKNKTQRLLSVTVGLNIPGFEAMTIGLDTARAFDSFIRELNTLGFIIDSPKLLLNEEATRSGFEDAVEEAFNNANDEDIVVICFCGYGNAASSRIQFVDEFPKQMAPGLHNGNFKVFLTCDEFKELIRKKRKNKRCQLVLILDAEIGVNTRWTDAGDIQISSTKNHLFESELMPVSDFITTIINGIRFSSGKISYSDLIARGRFHLQLRSHTELPQIVFFCDPRNADNYIFSQEKNDEYRFIMSSNKNKWHVLSSDFYPPLLNAQAKAYTYPSRAATGATGEIQVNNDEILFKEQTTLLRDDQYYWTVPEKPALEYTIILGRPGPEAGGYELELLLSKIYMEGYGKWNRLALRHVIDRDEVGSTDQVPLNIYMPQNENEPYRVEYFAESRNYKFTWFVSGEEALLDFIPKLSNYFYLTELTNPLTNNSNHLDVNGHLTWIDDRTESRLLELNEHTITIEHGEVLIKPLSFTIIQREEFPVFCKVYLLLPDLSIRDITTPDISMLVSLRTAELILDDQEVLQQIFTHGNLATIKVLTSKTPIVVDFSQPAMAKTSLHGNRKP
jgi:hypothetical protein